MAQTIAEQILSHAVGRPVSPGELVTLRPDVIMAHDSLAPSIISILRSAWVCRTWPIPINACWSWIT